MILTITLNPAIDRSYRIDSFVAGGRYRILDATETIGGKGINVAKILHHLEHDVYTTGFRGGFNGKHIKSYLDHINLPNGFIEIVEESRNFSVINDLKTKQETILNEVGPRIKPEELELFLVLFRDILKEKSFDWVVMAGSVPQNIPTSIYHDLISIAKEFDVKVIVDAKTPYLNRAMEGKPYMLKPNKKEFMELVNMDQWDFDTAIRLGKDLVRTYETRLLLSLGSEGSVYIDEKRILKAEFEPISILNTIGSGDSLVAGYLSGAIDGLNIEESLIRATAYSLSNALKKGIGCIELDEVEKLEKTIHIKELS